MYSRCQRLNLFFSNLGQMIGDAIHSECHALIDIGDANINVDGVNFRRQAINPVNGEIIFRAGIIPVRHIVNQRPSFQSSALEAFVDARRRAEIKNNILSEKYDANEYQLRCPISLDFPLIPVMFNGRLYDYDSLMQGARGEFIKDPLTQEQIKLAPHVIQPHFSAQEQIDKLIVEMNNRELQIPRI